MAVADVPFSFSEEEIDRIKVNERAGEDKGSELKTLLNKRRGKRGAVTKNVNYVNDNLSNTRILNNEKIMSDMDL